MKAVLDSNVLLIAIGRRSRYRLIWQAFLEARYQLIVSDDVLFEYKEVLQEHAAPGADGIVFPIFAESPDLIYKRIYFRWNAITVDPDDNKFFDAAVAAGADYLVTNDAHFNEAKQLRFPKINIVSADEFLAVLEREKENKL